MKSQHSTHVGSRTGGSRATDSLLPNAPRSTEATAAAPASSTASRRKRRAWTDAVAPIDRSILWHWEGTTRCLAHHLIVLCSVTELMVCVHEGRGRHPQLFPRQRLPGGRRRLRRGCLRRGHRQGRWTFRTVEVRLQHAVVLRPLRDRLSLHRPVARSLLPVLGIGRHGLGLRSGLTFSPRAFQLSLQLAVVLTLVDAPFVAPVLLGFVHPEILAEDEGRLHPPLSSGSTGQRVSCSTRTCPAAPGKALWESAVKRERTPRSTAHASSTNSLMTWRSRACS